MDLAVSCISDSGDRHVIYTASGEILYEACYQMAERSISEVKFNVLYDCYLYIHFTCAC